MQLVVLHEQLLGVGVAAKLDGAVALLVGAAKCPHEQLGDHEEHRQGQEDCGQLELAVARTLLSLALGGTHVWQGNQHGPLGIEAVPWRALVEGIG